jgi:site-specific DNA recombinase
MSAIIYARVSTDEQAQNGVSLDAQLAACTQYAQAHGLGIADVIVDAGLSGKSSDRPGYQKLVKLVTGKKIQHVICMKLDRLSRSTIDTLHLLNLMAAKDVQLHLTDSGLVDSQSSDGELMMTLRAAFAQAERRKISERTKAALDRKRELGQRISGKAPYGYVFDDGRVVENHAEQAVIGVVRRLKNEGLSVLQIIRQLASQGFTNRQGNEFSESTIYSILRAA